MKTDVLIIGGGPIGLAAALALGGSALHTPLNVMLIDARDPRAFAALSETPFASCGKTMFSSAENSGSK